MMDNNCDNCLHEKLEFDSEPCRECLSLTWQSAEYFTKWEPKGEGIRRDENDAMEDFLVGDLEDQFDALMGEQ